MHLRKSVKLYFSAVVNIPASQIDYYEKYLDVSPHQSLFTVQVSTPY